MYRGASPFKALYVNRRILNSILLSTGSQCSSYRVVVIWSYFLSPEMSHAAVFCTLWSFSMM